MYCDIGFLWLVKEDLFDEWVVVELSLVDSNLFIFFVGVDFGEEVLGVVKLEF